MPSMFLKYYKTGYFFLSCQRGSIGALMQQFDKSSYCMRINSVGLFFICFSHQFMELLWLLLKQNVLMGQYLFQFFQLLLMHVNIWNIRNSKQKLAILQTTHAQKRHLQSIFLAKSTINTNATSTSRSPNTNKNTFRKTNKPNQNIDSSQAQSRIKLRNNSYDLLGVGKKLQVYSSINRLIKKKAIDQQNNKMLSRIITTAPTLNRDNWAKMCEQNEKYKQNLHRKHKQLDYSRQALKLLSQSPKFKFIKVPFTTSRSLHKIYKIRS